MIIRAGVNIYPDSFEPVLDALRSRSGSPVFRRAALVGVWNEETQDEAVVLFYQLDPAGPKPSLTEIKARVDAAVGEAVRPDHFIEVDRFQVVGRQSKLDKKHLRSLAVKQLGAPYAETPVRGGS